MVKRLLVWASAFVILAVLVDRSTLFIWSFQVIRYYRSLQASLPTAEQPLPSDSAALAARARLPLSAAPPDAMWPVRLMEVGIRGCLVNPTSVLVDGRGGLHLTFFPPVLAWSTRLWPPNPNRVYFDDALYQPMHYYQYEIAVLQNGGAPVIVELYQGLHHNRSPLSEGQIRPLFWP